MNVTETATASAPSSADPGLLARVFGILVSPKETYAAVAARPRWLGVMAITLVIAAGCQYIIMSSPAMQDAMVDQATRNPNVTDAQIDGIERFISILPYVIAGATLILGPLFSSIVAGILLLIFSTLMGGTATFKQVFALVAHSGVVSSISGLVSAGLILIGAQPTGATPPGTNLGIFVPMLEETSFIVSFLSSIDLILVWWALSLSIGLGVLYKRSTGGIATSLICIYLVIALILGFVRSGA
jgi:hypothetical protein